MLSTFNRGTLIASALVAAGVTGTALDPNGPAGIMLFGVAAGAALYLLGRPLRHAARRTGSGRRATPARPPTAAAPIVRGRTVLVVAGAMGVLFSLWLAADVARPVMYAVWWTFSVLGLWLMAVAVLGARRSFSRTSH